MHCTLGTTFRTSNISEAFTFSNEGERGTITKTTPTVSLVLCARFTLTTALIMRSDPIVDFLQTHVQIIVLSSDDESQKNEPTPQTEELKSQDIDTPQQRQDEQVKHKRHRVDEQLGVLTRTAGACQTHVWNLPREELELMANRSLITGRVSTLEYLQNRIVSPYLTQTNVSDEAPKQDPDKSIGNHLFTKN